MTEDYQRTLEDNLSLKKALQVARNQNDRFQQQISELRRNYQQILQKNAEINRSHNQLQRKNHLQQTEYSKDVTTLTSQIEDLKLFIQQKQQEMENIQLKVFPNLDPNMIRVKLIPETDDSYEAAEKKDREIAKLKEKLTQIEKKYNIAELTLNTKQKQFKVQLQETKNYYQTENEKILKELNNLLSKKEAKSYNKQVFKNQRKQLEQLRCIVHLHTQNQDDLRRQLTTVKNEKEKLYLQISQLNQKKILDRYLTSQHTQLSSIKEEKKKIEDEVARKNNEVNRLQKKIKNIEKEYKQKEQEMTRDYTRSKQKWENEKSDLAESLRKQKEQYRKTKDSNERKQDEYQRLNQNFKTLEKKLQLNKQQYQRLKSTVSDLQKHSKYQQINKEQQLFKNKLKKQLSEQVLNIPKESMQEQNNQEETRRLDEALRGQKGKLRDFLEKYIDLKKKYENLQKKLKKANQKIMELLQTKIALGSPKASPKHFQFPTDNQRKISPPKSYEKHQHNHINQHIENPNTESQHFITTADFRPHQPETHSRTNPVFNKQFLSPQDNRHIRIEDQSLDNDRSYYEKSLKIKNQRFKELKCINHQPQIEE